MAKPQPRVVSEVCSLCGLDWKRHGTAPTTETCIILLLGEVRSLNARLAHRPLVQPIPYPAPYPVYPRPLWSWQTGVTSPNFNGARVWNGTSTLTPQASNSTPQAISGVATRA